MADAPLCCAFSAPAVASVAFALSRPSGFVHCWRDLFVGQSTDHWQVAARMQSTFATSLVSPHRLAGAVDCSAPPKLQAEECSRRTNVGLGTGWDACRVALQWSLRGFIPSVMSVDSRSLTSTVSGHPQVASCIVVCCDLSWLPSSCPVPLSHRIHGSTSLRTATVVCEREAT